MAETRADEVGEQEEVEEHPEGGQEDRRSEG